MRNPDRIRFVTRALEDCWRQFPDLRFGQFIQDVYRHYGSSVSMWEMGEDEWLAAIRKFSDDFNELYVLKKP